jgi:divalent metal cation (Fe/Co/Zn/Cd) transporter
MARTDVTAAFPAREHVEAALRISTVSVLWTVCASTAAVVIGLRSQTVVLVALGAIGYVDGIGSVTLAVHFRDALHNEELSQRLERLSHIVVLVCLGAVGASAVIVGVVRLVRGDAGDGSIAGAVLAGVSAAVLLALSLRKQRVAGAVMSEALRSDGHLSGIGAAQAAVALAGTAVTRWFSWTAADSVATTVVGAVAVGLAVYALITRDDTP